MWANIAMPMPHTRHTPSGQDTTVFDGSVPRVWQYQSVLVTLLAPPLRFSALGGFWNLVPVTSSMAPSLGAGPGMCYSADRHPRQPRTPARSEAATETSSIFAAPSKDQRPCHRRCSVGPTSQTFSAATYMFPAPTAWLRCGKALSLLHVPCSIDRGAMYFGT